MIAPYHTDSRATLYRGDNLAVLRQMPDNSVDSIVSDVPYGLGNPPDALAMLAAWLDSGHYEVSGKGFMGREWDCFVPQPILWRECLRVLKPGGHLLSFAGTRTIDLVGLGLRIAGFELRDTIRYMGDDVAPAWISGSGFPKNHNISTAIDKKLKAQRRTVGTQKHAPKFNARAQGYRQKDNGFNRRSDERQTFDLTVPTSAPARQWDGWGTALKPGWEPIILARKPLDGTIADNVLKHGTGGINIDACRVVGSGGGTSCTNRDEHGKCMGHNNAGFSTSGETIHGVDSNPIGRWPANVIHDGSPAILAEFAAFGESVSSGGPTSGSSKSNTFEGGWQKRSEIGHSDSGTPARFFYCSKASRSDRSEGLTGPARQYSHDGRDKPIENAYQRNASIAVNNHPTVKPTALMRWCVRLVTPPGGVCLDMYMGSGSTGKACMLEGFRFIGIDLDTDGTYLPIATARIIHAQKMLGKRPKGRRTAEAIPAGQMALEFD